MYIYIYINIERERERRGRGERELISMYSKQKGRFIEWTKWHFGFN